MVRLVPHARRRGSIATPQVATRVMHRPWLTPVPPLPGRVTTARAETGKQTRPHGQDRAAKRVVLGSAPPRGVACRRPAERRTAAAAIWVAPDKAAVLILLGKPSTRGRIGSPSLGAARKPSPPGSEAGRVSPRERADTAGATVALGQKCAVR